MKKIKHHKVVLKNADGNVEIYPMKQWLRENPAYLPKGLHPDVNTSHGLRRALKKQGWEVEEEEDRVLLIKPSDDGDVSFADELLGDDSDDIESTDYEKEIIEAEEITFGLERDLQAALRANIEQLEPGLKIIDGGKERVTEAGEIDITAMDSKGNIVVIELKAGTAAPKVIAQILSYMSTVAEEDNKPVRGILIAGDFHKRVVLAARAVSNLELKKYSFQFAFEKLK